LVFLGLLDVLKDFYGQVDVPPAVASELLNGYGAVPIVSVSQIPFIQIRSPKDVSRVRQLMLRLDEGESEAIALALESQDPLLLMDESHGRSIASQFNIDFTGTLGILLRAKIAGKLAAVAPLVDHLQKGLGFYISARIRTHVLGLAGELL
jgi:predicted nucleic acid-binding protein